MVNLEQRGLASDAIAGVQADAYLQGRPAGAGPYKKTHNLPQLVAALRAGGVSFPADLEDAFDLGPFAVALRYDDLAIEEDEPFDRAWALACVDRVESWARSVRQGASQVE